MPSPRRVALSLDIQLLYKNHTEVFAGVQRYADEAGWGTIIDNWPEETLGRSPRGQPAFHGVIARVTAHRLGLIDVAAKFGVPVVNVQLDSPACDRLPGVFPDFREIGRLQAEHLLARGVRNFAFMAIGGRRTEVLQFDAFKATVEAAGHAVTHLSMPELWDDALADHRQARTSIEHWMNAWQRPIGVASATDDVLRFLAQFSRERGWRVPEDVALIGSRNEEHLCERPRPGISSVEIGYDRIGYEAARMLDRMMGEARKQQAKGARRSKQAPSAKPEHVILPPVGVVGRESTDSLVTDDPLVAEAQAFILDQCHTVLDVADVAEKVSVSAKTLQNHFVAALQRTVAEEIRRVRVEKAKRDLAGSDLSVHEIAKRAGFTSNARLCEVFQREVGISPSEYRQQRTVPRKK